MSVRDAVRHSLQASILRRLEGVSTVRRHPKTVAFRTYQWVHEALLILAGVGLVHPVLNVLVGASDGQSLTPQETSTFLTDLLQYPLPLLVSAGAALLLWLTIRVSVTLYHLADSVPLYSACRLELGGVESRLHDALATAEPLRSLAAIQQDASVIVNRYHQMNGWPWSVGPTDRRSKASVERKAAVLCEEYAAGWTEVPSDAREEVIRR